MKRLFCFSTPIFHNGERYGIKFREINLLKSSGQRVLSLIAAIFVSMVVNAAEITLWTNLSDGDVLALDAISAAGGQNNDKVRFYIKNNTGQSRAGYGVGGFGPSTAWDWENNKFIGPNPCNNGTEWYQEYTIQNINNVANGADGIRVRFWQDQGIALTKVTLITTAAYIYYQNKSVTLNRFSEVGSYNAVPQTLSGSTNGVTYSIAKISEGLTANINSSTGAISNIGGSAKGGAMVIKAQNSSYSAFYVVTVPFEAPHTWIIANNPLQTKERLLHNSDTYGAPFTLEFEQISHDANNKYTELKRGLYSNATEVNGNNYAYIDATAGLLVTAGKKKFGARASQSDDTSQHLLGFVDGTAIPEGYTSKDVDTRSAAIQTLRTYNVDVLAEPLSMDLANGASFTIPKLKAGQYIRIWWSSASRAGSGCKYAASNVTDLEGKGITSTFTHSGWLGDGSTALSNVVAQEKSPIGCTIFRVKADGDVTFTSRNGWSWISKIDITNEFVSELRMIEGPDWNRAATGNQYGYDCVVDYNYYNGSIVVVGGEPELRTYRNWAGTTRSRAQNAKNCDYQFETFGRNIQISFPTDDDELWDTNRDGKKAYRRYPMTVSGGTGNIKITQRALYGDNGENYVLDKNERWIAVGEVTPQQYPYTWDFTEHNMSDDQFCKSLNNSGYWNLFGHTVEANSYGKWSLTNNNTTFDMQSCAAVLDSNNRKIYKPLFAQGSELVYASENGPVTINEFKGLGITFAASGENWMDENDNPEKFVTIMGNGQGHLSGVKEIMVPYVKNGQKVYIQTTDGNVSITLDDTNGSTAEESVVGSGAKGWKVTTSVAKGTHVRLALDPTATIYRVAVTDIEKPINQYGYATESRDRSIDHAITSEFVAGEPKAYYMKDFSLEDAEGNKIGIVKMVEASENKGIVVNHNQNKDHFFSTIPAETGIVIYAPGASSVTIPLFVPAINVENQKGSTNLESNLLLPSVTGASISGANGDYILTNVYNHKGKTGEETGSIGYYYAKAGTLGANKSYLHLEKSSPAKAVFIMMPFDEETTGISKPEADSQAGDYYTLDGLKVNGKPSAKGLYIKNGKKYVVK